MEDLDLRVAKLEQAVRTLTKALEGITRVCENENEAMELMRLRLEKLEHRLLLMKPIGGTLLK